MAITTFSIRSSQLTVSPTSSLQTAVLFSPIKRKNSPSIDEDTYTQFAYACKQLGVELGSSSVPRAKGRVERLNQTLQSRLPVRVETQTHHPRPPPMNSKHSYKKELKESFSPPFSVVSVFCWKCNPKLKKINLILAVLCKER